MKTPFPRVRFASVAAAILALAGTDRAAADINAAHPDFAATSAIRVVSEQQYEEFGFEKLRGSPVRAADGRQLGRVRDLVIDPRSGDIRFALVSGGGFFGFGGDARLLPFEALIVDPRDRGFMTRLQQVDWELLPIVTQTDVKERRLALAADQRRNVERLRDQAWARSFATLADADASSSRADHVFASSLFGKELHADNQEVGEVEDVFVDVQRGRAMAVVEIDPDFTGSEQDYLIPLKAVQVPAGETERVHTSLSAREFQQATGLAAASAPAEETQDSGWVRRSERRAERAEERAEREAEVRRARTAVDAERQREIERERNENSPSPTGQPSGYNANENTAVLESAARAVRQSWEAHDELRPYRLRVAPRENRLVFEGTVPSAELWERAEDAAEAVISRIEVENRIRIDDQRR